MPLLYDIARCQGALEDKTTGYANVWTCDRRETCARYIERNQGGPRTMTHANLCSEGGDSYILVSDNGKTTENL